MARLRANLAYGTVTDNPLLVGATTLNSAELPRLPAVAAPDVMAVTLDPHREHGEPEIVHVTSYDGSATSATILRGQEGTTAREHPSGTRWDHAATAEDVGLGTVLARTDHNPGSQDVLSTTSTTYVDADAANLAVTFTVPASGQVDVHLEAGCDTTNAGVPYQWALREDTTVVSGTSRSATRATMFTRISTRIRVSGLTPGATLTWKWAHRVSDAAATGRVVCGTGSATLDWGPATIEVRAA